MKANRRAGALALAAGAIVCGCSTEPIFKHRPGKTFGEIYVGDVRVSSRERLVNDRLQQDAWLQGQLKSDPTDFGTQGASDLRSFTGSVARLEANLDQTQIGAYRAQQAQNSEALRRQNELAEMDARLQRQYKQRQLEYMQQQPATAFAYTPPTAAGGIPQQATPPGAPATQQDIRNLKDDLSKFTIPPSQIVLPEKLKPSPMEIFRDRLEYRALIRNEIIENALDDRHDLKGHTLLRFDLDATVRPHEDTSAWAIVEVEVDRGAMKERCNADLAYRWRRFVEREIDDNTLRIMRHAFPAGRAAWASASGQPAQRVEAFVAGMVATLPDHVLFAIQNDWIDNYKGVPVELPNMPARGTGTRLEMESQYATVTAIILHRARTLGNRQRSAAEVPLEDYARVLHRYIGIAYATFANAAEVKHLEAKVAPKPPAGAAPAPAPAPGGAARKDRPGPRVTIFDRLLGMEERGTPPAQQEQSQKPAAAKDPFCEDLFSEARIYAYGATPKESVQRIAEVASRRNFNEVMLALSFLGGNTAAGKAYFDYVKVNEGIFQALRRQPLAVAFNRSAENADCKDGNGANIGGQERKCPGNPKFGWILGPRFGIRDDGQESNFRHTAAFTPLSGVLSLPGWLDEVTFNVTTYWVTESGRSDPGTRTNTQDPPTNPQDVPFVLNSGGRERMRHGPDLERKKMDERKVTVRLRQDLSTITDALAQNPVRAPRAFHRQHLTFAEGSPAQITIPGQNLWRNPTVLLGGQQADEVVVLPDMRGIIARFKEIKLPDAREGKDEMVPLTVWTSEGNTDVALVVVKPLKPAEAKVAAALASPAVISGKPASIKLTPPQKGFYQMKVWVGADSGVAQEATISEISNDGTTAKVTIPALDKVKSGEGAMLQVIIKHAPDNRPVAPFGGPMTGVYFTTEEETKAKVEPKAIDRSKLGSTTFIVSLPVKAGVLYPDTEAGFSVAVAAGTGSPVLEATPCNKENARNLKENQCAFKLSLPKDGKFESDGEYKVTVTAKETKIPVNPESIKVTVKPPAQQAKAEEPKKPDPAKTSTNGTAAKDAAKNGGAKGAGKKDETKKKG